MSFYGLISLWIFVTLQCTKSQISPATVTWRAMQIEAPRLLITAKPGVAVIGLLNELTFAVQGRAVLIPLTRIPTIIAEFNTTISVFSLSSIVENILKMDSVQHIEADSVVNLPVGGEFLRIIHSSLANVQQGSVPRDPLLQLQWGLSDMNMKRAWESTTGVGHNTRVAVLDTGVDYNHLDLKANMFVNTAELNGVPFVDDDGNGYVDDIYGWNAIKMNGHPFDDHWHGTHCAGILGAVTNNSLGVAGANWAPTIVPCKFLSHNGEGRLSDAITCIDYSLAIGASVSSNSWGSSANSATLKSAIKVAAEAGQLFVVAAGNSGTNNDEIPEYPAAYNLSNIISVAALTQNNALAEWSNYGPSTVHIAAPGFRIASTMPDDVYGFASGTSMATPYAAGVVSLMRGYHPEWDFEMVKAVLQMTAAPIKGTGKLVTDGKVDAAAAIEYKTSTSTSKPSTTTTTQSSEGEEGEGLALLAVSTETCEVACLQSGMSCDDAKNRLINSDLEACMDALKEHIMLGNFVEGKVAQMRSLHPGGCFVSFWGSTYHVNINKVPEEGSGCRNRIAEFAASYKVCVCGPVRITTDRFPFFQYFRVPVGLLFESTCRVCREYGKNFLAIKINFHKFVNYTIITWQQLLGGNREGSEMLLRV